MSTVNRILILDDEADFARFVETVATELGYDAVVATTSPAFQAAYLAEPPDVIVLDIVMPETDGIETIQWLVRQGCSARVIIISGYNPTYATAAREIGESIGAMQITQMQKPVKLTALQARLQLGSA
jgi:DNA-binding response OmpR family regulator